MKRWICITLLLSLGLFTSALPFPIPLPPPSNHEITPYRPRFDKRTDHIEPDISLPPKTPSHKDDPNFPKPGESGTYHDKKTNLVWLMYGDDMINHAKHLTYTHGKDPKTLMPMALAHQKEKTGNRRDALKGISSEPDMVRDEKPLAMLSYKHLGITPTVYMVPRPESNKEGGHSAKFKKLLEDNPGSKGVLRTNLLHGDPTPDMGKVKRPKNEAGGVPEQNTNAKQGSQTQSKWARLKAHFPTIPPGYKRRQSVKATTVTTPSGVVPTSRLRPVPHAENLSIKNSPLANAVKKKSLKDKLLHIVKSPWSRQ